MSYAGNKDGVKGGPGREEEPLILRRVRERVRVRHYSIRTEQAYVGWVWRFIAANAYTDPRQLGPR